MMNSSLSLRNLLAASLLLLTGGLVTGCSDDAAEPVPVQIQDTSHNNPMGDTGLDDVSDLDTGVPDAQVPDADPTDTQVPDADPPDVQEADADLIDTQVPDADPPDTDAPQCLGDDDCDRGTCIDDICVDDPLAPGWSALSARADHVCAIDPEGALYCWGRNSHGQLGQGDRDDRPARVQVGEGTDWEDVRTGTRVTCGIRDQGRLFCWGFNDASRLGTGSADDIVLSPEEVPAPQGQAWVHMDVYSLHACGITDQGALYCWGGNFRGQLGIGSEDDATSPTRVGNDADWTWVATSSSSTCGVRSGALYCWGENIGDVLGTNDGLNSNTPIRIGDGQSWTRVHWGFGTLARQACALDTTGRLYCRGGVDAPGPATMNLVAQQVTSVSLGSRHACLVDENDQVLCWGENPFKGLGTGDQLPHSTPAPVTAVDGIDPAAAVAAPVAAGEGFTCALPASGAPICWGYNRYGQLGIDVYGGSRTAPGLADGNHTFTSLVLSGWMNQTYGCAVTDTGALYCWGSNTWGQLGTGDTYSRRRPVPIGQATDWTQVSTSARHTCGLRGTALYCWGLNDRGQLGTGDEVTHQTPTRVAQDLAIRTVSAGVQHTCAITTEDHLYCWGAGGSGRLGTGSTNNVLLPTRIGSATNWSDIEAGFLFTCGLRGADAYCWGSNIYGQVGHSGPSGGSAPNVLNPTQVAGNISFQSLSTGYFHVCGVDGNDELYCWGDNNEGKLGIGSLVHQNAPRKVTGSWTQVSAGSSHTCAIDDGGAAWCWGPSWDGRLGVEIPDEWTATPVRLDGDPDWVTLSSGNGTTGGLRPNGKLYTWGSNVHGGRGDATAWEID